MEQVITKTQRLILNEFQKDPFLTENFYFTGGTALSNYYLHHRYSEDLDFFSEKPFDIRQITNTVNNWAKKLNFSYKLRSIEGAVSMFSLNFKKGGTLKVDFGHYFNARIEKGPKDKNMEIDSLLDIAANKLITIPERTEVKDYVDLYFLLKKNFTIWDITYAVEKKFRRETDIFLLSSDFLKSESFEFLPKMILPLTLKELKDFYKQQAVLLASKAVI